MANELSYCTSCEGSFNRFHGSDMHDALYPYIMKYEPFCSDECMKIEYANRKANND